MISSEKLKDQLRLRCLMSLKWCCPVHLESFHIESYICNCILDHDWIRSTNDIFSRIQKQYRIGSIRWQWVRSWILFTMKYVINRINSRKKNTFPKNTLFVLLFNHFFDNIHTKKNNQTQTSEIFHKKMQKGKMHFRRICYSRYVLAFANLMSISSFIPVLKFDNNDFNDEQNHRQTPKATKQFHWSIQLFH